MSSAILVTGIAGAVTLLYTVFLFIRRRAFMSGAAKADGKVVANEKLTTTDSEGSTTTRTHPVVEFATASGKSTRYTDDYGSMLGAKYQVGTAVPILYDPDNPQDAHISRFLSLWGRVLTVGALSAGSLIAFGILRIIDS